MTSAALTVSEKPALQVAAYGEMSVQGIVDRKRKIREVLEAVMVEGEHYGKIPGCGDKPSLYKAGAEVLATTFGLVPQFVITRNDLPGGHREYEFVCRLVHIATGAIVGEGVGCCSTMESKYRWRNAQRKCPACGNATILKSKNPGEGWFCWQKKGGCGAQFALDAKEVVGQEAGRVENPDIADTYNTVLKIAKKRAQVDCTLTAVGASDVLTQDLEDLPPGSVPSNSNADIPPAISQPAPATKPPPSRPAAQTANDEHEQAALELMVELKEATTPEAVRALAQKCNALPKGSRARAAAREVYDERLAAVSG